LSDEWALAGEASCLRHEARPGRGIQKAAIGLLRGEKVASLALELRRESWDRRGRGWSPLLKTDIARWLGLEEACRRTAAKTGLLGLLEALRTRRNITRLLGHQSAAKSSLLRILLEKLRILLLELRVLLLLLKLGILLLELGITSTRKSCLHRILVPRLLPLGHGGRRRKGR
jgi:hypothetical protein